MISKRSESASSLVNERAQIAPQAFRQRRNKAQRAAVLTASEQGVYHTARGADYILAHARLHTNPLDWIEKSKSFDLLFSWLPELGLKTSEASMTCVARQQ